MGEKLCAKWSNERTRRCLTITRNAVNPRRRRPGRGALTYQRNTTWRVGPAPANRPTPRIRRDAPTHVRRGRSRSSSTRDRRQSRGPPPSRGHAHTRQQLTTRAIIRQHRRRVIATHCCIDAEKLKPGQTCSCRRRVVSCVRNIVTVQCDADRLQPLRD